MVISFLGLVSGYVWGVGRGIHPIICGQVTVTLLYGHMADFADFLLASSKAQLLSSSAFWAATVNLAGACFEIKSVFLM